MILWNQRTEVKYLPNAKQFEQFVHVHIVAQKELRVFGSQRIEAINLGLGLLQTVLASSQKVHQELIIGACLQMGLLLDPQPKGGNVLINPTGILVQLLDRCLLQLWPERAYVGHVV